ncbi:type VII secretion integral membrane protein EccD [Mycobacterium sp. 1100029.7]|nr:type VII secretion integral membrane protein EccD [Mycobacterium sp. 1100029.7]
MSVPDPGLRRVSIHAGTAVLDAALPATVPIGSVLPSLIDLFGGQGLDELKTSRCHISVPGSAALDMSATLAQSGIRDGAVLVLTQSAPPPPRLRYDDTAQAVSDTLHPQEPKGRQDHRAARRTAATAAGCVTGIGCLAMIRNTLMDSTFRYQGTSAGVAVLVASVTVVSAMLASRVYRDAMAGLTLSLIATAFTAVAGFLAVPGPAGLPNVLLAATAAAVTAVLVMRLVRCAAGALIAVSCFAMVIAVVAFVGVLTAAPVSSVGAACVLVSLGLLGLAGHAAIVLSGLSPTSGAGPDDDLPAKALRADIWLAGLLAAFSCSAATGAIVTVLSRPSRPGCLAFAATTGVLLLRPKSSQGSGVWVGAMAAVATIVTIFGVAAIDAAAYEPWIVATTAVLAAATMWLGFVAPGRSPAPVARKAMELFERSLLIAMVPWTCWISGLYETARGLHLTWS